MHSGLLQSAAALDLLGRMHEVRAQNLANVNTAGYRRRIAAADAFAHALRRAGGLPLPGLRVDVDQSQGDLEKTDRPTDLALVGEGFFALETPRGVRFTRNGNFSFDAEGFLVAHDGARVLGESGPIQIDPTRGDVRVDPNGSVRQQGAEVGRLRLVRFDDPSRLDVEDSGRFRETPGAGARDANDVEVRQGFLERSNVDAVDELVQMIAGFRAFEAAQRVMVGIDRVRAQAIGSRR